MFNNDAYDVTKFMSVNLQYIMMAYIEFIHDSRKLTTKKEATSLAIHILRVKGIPCDLLIEFEKELDDDKIED